ncbi:formyltransferase family protein [Vibrio lentus]
MCSTGIALAGKGHGGYVALKSLQKEFDEITLVSDDVDLIKTLRSADKIVNSLEDVESKYIVCASYMEIIPQNIINNKIIINTHPSLLPKYRGLHSLAWAMLNKEKKVGFTIHLMNEFIDDGDIIAQYEVNTGKKTSKELMELFDKYVLENLGDIVKRFIFGEIKPKPQKESDASWCCKRNLNDCLIDFNSSFSDLEVLLRVLVSPYPHPILKIKDEQYYVIDAKVTRERTKMHVGRIVNVKNSKVYIKAKDSILIVENLKHVFTGQEVEAIKLLRLGMRLC